MPLAESRSAIQIDFTNRTMPYWRGVAEREKRGRVLEDERRSDRGAEEGGGAEHAQCVDDALCSRKSAFAVLAMAARREHSSLEH